MYYDEDQDDECQERTAMQGVFTFWLSTVVVNAFITYLMISYFF